MSEEPKFRSYGELSAETKQRHEVFLRGFQDFEKGFLDAKSSDEMRGIYTGFSMLSIDVIWEKMPDDFVEYVNYIRALADKKATLLYEEEQKGPTDIVVSQVNKKVLRLIFPNLLPGGN